jgi:hypothetical protein
LRSRTLNKINVFDSSGGQRALVSRESARRLSEELDRAISGVDPGLELNFEGVEAVTPSFVDELLGMIDQAIQRNVIDSKLEMVIVFAYPPTRLSSKFSAVGRGRGYEVSEVGESRWLMTKAA